MDKDNKEESDEENVIDMFDDIPDPVGNIMYKEYFDRDVPADEYEENEDSDEYQDDEEEGNDVEDNYSRKRNKNKLLPSSDEEDDGPVKSSHEVIEGRLAKKISRLEEVAIG